MNGGLVKILMKTAAAYLNNNPWDFPTENGENHKMPQKQVI
jgi:hypothetical protein